MDLAQGDEAIDLPVLEAGEIFVEAIGSILEYAWTMRNHRGYLDAVQLRLLNLETRKTYTVQLEAMASSLHALAVSPVQ